MVTKDCEFEDLDDDAVTAWVQFLQGYSRGHVMHHNSPKPPSQLPKALVTSRPGPKPMPSFSVPLYPDGKIRPEVAIAVARFYAEFNFLPPPRAEAEPLRTRIIKGYNLDRPDQLANFDRCTALVHTFFDRVCTFSLFKDNVQVVVSVAGDFPVDPGYEMVPETGICSHVVLRRDCKVVELGEIQRDWRFEGNPLCSGDGLVKGYVGVPIMLEVDPSAVPEDSTPLAVGVLAVMDSQPIPPLTPVQIKVLEDLTGMLSVQIRSTWEGWRRGTDARLRTSVTDFLNKALVHSNRSYPLPILTHPTVPVPSTSPPSPTLPAILDEAAHELRNMLDADLALIIDLTPFHALDEPHNGLSFNWLNNSQEPRVKPRRGKRVLGCSLNKQYDEWINKFRSPEAMRHLAAFLTLHARTHQTVFDSKATPEQDDPALSGLEPLLPAQMAHLAIPFYSANRPDLLLLVASANPFVSFSPTQITYASNLGVILVAHYVQTRIVEADAAKTTFVSQIRYLVIYRKFVITHELRTPLHGLLGQLELLKDAISANDLTQVPSLLESANHCAVVLQDFLNDVLDFGTMAQSNPMSIGDADTRPRGHMTTDMAALVVETAQLCWLKRRQWSPVSNSSETASPTVKLLVYYQDCSPDTWHVTFDASGLRRILYNLISNSLKCTSTGTISVSLRPLYRQVGDHRHMVELQVQDTGCGIPPAFIDRLFEPFTQADSFRPGAGLGLHITKMLVERMDGDISVQSQLGLGSTFTVIFPVQRSEIIPFTPTDEKLLCYSITDAQPSPLPQIPISGCPQAHRVGVVNGAVIDIQDTVKRDKESQEEQTLAGISTVVQNDNTAVKPNPQVHGVLASGESAESGTLRVLVVDDNTISRRILVTMLRKLNISYAQAENGIEAIEVFRIFKPHVVWTDVSMPMMDGVVIIAMSYRLWTDISNYSYCSYQTAAREMRKIEETQGLPPSYTERRYHQLWQLRDWEHIRKEALLGGAALDEWLVKGQSNLRDLRKTLTSVERNLKNPLMEHPAI
ncbi:hypothetical protein K439DRAFT_1662824 [Ramaria rubella]|nr:hypothetical protein K439DRAFT_1662824 [Ramaria rubella]